MFSDLEQDLDLGDGHWLAFTIWKPDRDSNPQYAHLPDNDRIGAIITHDVRNGSPCQVCQGSMWFDCQVVREVFPGHPMWTASSWDPLTCAPSFMCHCGDHGFISNGKWVRA